MKIVENNAKCSEIVIFDLKFYLNLQSFFEFLSPRWGFCQKNLSQGRGFSMNNLVAWGGGGGEWLPVKVIPALIWVQFLEDNHPIVSNKSIS